MVSASEIHVRATATGAWMVQVDTVDVPLSWHTSETAAEQAALLVAEQCLERPTIVVHDRYGRYHEAPPRARSPRRRPGA